jgi:hypothetical protein
MYGLRDYSRLEINKNNERKISPIRGLKNGEVRCPRLTPYDMDFLVCLMNIF